MWNDTAKIPEGLCCGQRVIETRNLELAINGCSYNKSVCSANDSASVAASSRNDPPTRMPSISETQPRSEQDDNPKEEEQEENPKLASSSSAATATAAAPARAAESAAAESPTTAALRPAPEPARATSSTHTWQAAVASLSDHEHNFAKEARTAAPYCAIVLWRRISFTGN